MSLADVVCCQVEVAATGDSSSRGGLRREREREIMCVCVIECDQVQQSRCTPTISG